jgi:hypothetical protein
MFKLMSEYVSVMSLQSRFNKPYSLLEYLEDKYISRERNIIFKVHS